MARRKGRKALPAAERRSRHLHMYLTPPEYAVVRQFRKRNESGSDFLRRLVLPLVDTLVAEREAAKAAGAATATAENPTPVSPENGQREALVAKAKDALADYRGQVIWAQAAQTIAEESPELVLTVVRESLDMGLSARECWFRLKERAAE